MGLPLLYGSPPRRGGSEPSPGGRLPTPRFSSCGQEHSFRYHQVHLACPQAVICWMLGFRSCATPIGTSRRGTLYILSIWYLVSRIKDVPVIPVKYHEVPRGYHQYLFCIALRPICGSILARTGESWLCGSSNASRSYSSRTLQAVR